MKEIATMLRRIFVLASATLLIVCLSGCGTRETEPRVSQQARAPAKSRSSPAPSQRSGPFAPEVRYLLSADAEGFSRAVYVQGYPLVFTRQILPVDEQGKVVSPESTTGQIDKLLELLGQVLTQAGSNFDQLVRVHAYVDGPGTLQQFRSALAQRTRAERCPAFTAVQSRLPTPEAKIALDVIAYAQEPVAAVSLQGAQVGSPWLACADAAIVPPGGTLYLSGYPEKGSSAEAAEKSAQALLGMLGDWKLGIEHVVQIKVFLQPMESVEEVETVLKKVFASRPLPPITYVEWIASVPLEIELIAHLPAGSFRGQEPIVFYNPEGVKPSPNFSRAAAVQIPQQLFIGGLLGQASVDGTTQVEQIFDQLEQILKEAGSDLRHLAKATYYVSDKETSSALDKLRPQYFDPTRPPAASKVTVPGVAHAGSSVVMDMIAVPKP